MAVRFRKDRNKWFATIGEGSDRVSRSFETEPEAAQWEAAAKLGVIEKRQEEQRIKEAQPKGTMGHVFVICRGLDWAGKDPTQVNNAQRLVRMLGPTCLPIEVDAAAIDDLVVTMRQLGLNNGTIKRYLSALRVMLKRAQRLKMISVMPLFPETRLLKEPEPRDLVLPSEWLAELLDVMERREQRLSAAVTLFLWHMGCRVGEAVKLNWDRVDLARNRISFVKTKGNLPRTLPIPREVQPILKAMKARGSKQVFPISYGAFYDHYRRATHEVCDRLGLSNDVRKEWVIHTLRHTCLTELAKKGWSAPAISQWAGHKTLAVTQRYVHGSAINLEELMEC